MKKFALLLVLILIIGLGSYVYWRKDDAPRNRVASTPTMWPIPLDTRIPLKRVPQPYDEPSPYTTNGREVYFKNRYMPGADPSTFVSIENAAKELYITYGKDQNGVYYQDHFMAYADPASFEVLWEAPYEGCSDGYYARDKQRVFFEASIVLEADPETFEPRLNGYGLDKNNVYLNGEIVPGILPADFVEPVCNYG
jgi:hypothetical protein